MFDVDVNEVIENLDAEFAEQAEEVIEEVETETETELDEVDVEESTDEKVEEETPDIHNADEEKRNSAFAQLRRERDEATKLAGFLKRIADENGTSVEDMMKQYEESRLQQQAEQQNVPVEVLQKLNKLEQENEQIRNQTFTERFNNQVSQTMEKYKASNEELEATFKYAADNGLVDSLKNGSMTFEAAYRLAHMDSIIEKQVQNALQENLTQKKKRQQEAP